MKKKFFPSKKNDRKYFLNSQKLLAFFGSDINEINLNLIFTNEIRPYYPLGEQDRVIYVIVGIDFEWNDAKHNYKYYDVKWSFEKRIVE